MPVCGECFTGYGTNKINRKNGEPDFSYSVIQAFVVAVVLRWQTGIHYRAYRIQRVMAFPLAFALGG